MQLYSVVDENFRKKNRSRLFKQALKSNQLDYREGKSEKSAFLKRRTFARHKGKRNFKEKHNVTVINVASENFRLWRF